MPSRDEIIKILKSPPSNLTDEISKKIADQILNIPGIVDVGEIDPPGAYFQIGKPVKGRLPHYVPIDWEEAILQPEGEIDIPGTFMIIGPPEINKQVRFNLKFHKTVLNSIYKTKSAEKMVINLNASIKPK